MSPNDEWERSLMADDAVDSKKATEVMESMPKVLSGLEKTLASISTAMINMEKSMKRLQLIEASEPEGRPNKKQRQASLSEAHKDGNSSDGVGLLRSNEPDANLANEGNE